MVCYDFSSSIRVLSLSVSSFLDVLTCSLLLNFDETLYELIPVYTCRRCSCLLQMRFSILADSIV
jgi:hypothetical protein